MDSVATRDSTALIPVARLQRRLGNTVEWHWKLHGHVSQINSSNEVIVGQPLSFVHLQPPRAQGTVQTTVDGIVSGATASYGSSGLCAVNQSGVVTLDEVGTCTVVDPLSASGDAIAKLSRWQNSSKCSERNPPGSASGPSTGASRTRPISSRRWPTRRPIALARSPTRCSRRSVP